jgi:predicted nucleic acid-binding protein
MILFCDTSALVKLYIDETGSDLVREQMHKADAVAVARIAWVEAHAAFARRVREEPLDEDAIEGAKSALRSDWQRFIVLEINQDLVERAGEFADTFALRAYDSAQLAAAAAAAARTEVFFACFDTRLNRVAKILGMASFLKD